MRRAARRDRNEKSLWEMFLALGCEVQPLNQAGLPDLLVNWQGRLALCEVKTATGTLRAAQQAFGARFPVFVVRTDADVRRIVNLLKRQVVRQMQPQETL